MLLTRSVPPLGYVGLQVSVLIKAKVTLQISLVIFFLVEFQLHADRKFVG